MIPYVHIRFIAPKREPAKVPTYGHDLSCEMNTLPVNWASAHRRTEKRSQRHARGYDSPDSSFGTCVAESGAVIGNAGFLLDS